MDNAVNVWMCSEHLVQCRLVRNIHLVKLRSLSAEELNAIEGDFRGVVKTVDNYNLVAMLEESEGGERPNVSSTTRR